MASDCYALGMVIYEVLSGKTPFYKYSSLAVVWKILQGERPERPQDGWFTDSIWGILELCWQRQPTDRISAKAVLLYLENGLPPPGSPPHSRRNVTIDVDDDSDVTSDED